MTLALQLQEALLSERVDPLTPDLVQGLRKDFLTLMGNIQRIKTYDEAEKVRLAFRTWRGRLDDLTAQMRQDFEARGREGLNGPAPLSKSEIDAAIRQMKPLWELSFEMGSFPMRSYDPAMEQWWPKGLILSKFQDEAPAWSARIKRKAPAAWKAMDYLATWAKNFSGHGPVQLRTKETENIQLAGFRVQLHGFEPGEVDPEFIPSTEAGLAFYRKRASAFMPLLLKKQLPIVMDSECSSSSGCDAAATYRHDHIRVSPWGRTNNPREFAHIMVHEMGHHIYQTVLSGEAHEAWRLFIKGGQIAVDLRDMLKALAKYGDNVWSVNEKRLEREDPILALQFMGLYDDPAYKDLDLVNTDRIKKYLDRGGDPIVHVSRSPITGYAQKNPEEAFCEALGRLVAYGPKTVLPEVASMLRSILPELRVESVDRGNLGSQLEEAVKEPAYDWIESSLNDGYGEDTGFGVEFDRSGSLEDRAEEVAYGLGYEEGRTGRPMGATKALLAWAKKRKMPGVKKSYDYGVIDGKKTLSP